LALSAMRYIGMRSCLALPCLALTFVALLMPATVLGVFGTHYRVPYVLGCIVVAGIQVKQPRRILAFAAVLIIGALFVVRQGFLISEWSRFDTQLQQYRSAIAKIEPGSKVVTALDQAESDDWWTGSISTRLFWHLSALVVIDASAFDPLLFSNPVRQSVAVHGEAKRIDMMLGQPAPTLWFTEKYKASLSADGKHAPLPWPEDYWGEWTTWYKDFDYLIRFSLAPSRERIVGPLTPIQRGAWFDLYKVNGNKDN